MGEQRASGFSTIGQKYAERRKKRGQERGRPSSPITGPGKKAKPKKEPSEGGGKRAKKGYVRQ